MLQTECFDGDIITNPPYKYTTEFVLKALELTQNKVAMFLKISALEGKERYQKIYRTYPPKDIYVFVSRMACVKGGKEYESGGAMCFAWFVWQKGNTDPPRIHWIVDQDLEDPNQIKLF